MLKLATFIKLMLSQLILQIHQGLTTVANVPSSADEVPLAQMIKLVCAIGPAH